MAWWLWIVLGLVLLVGEILTPGAFFMLFFGLGSLVTGVVMLTGVALPDWVQWLGFTVISVAMLVLFRERLKAGCLGGKPSQDVDALVGADAIVKTDIAPGATGQVELRGSAWSAKNIGEGALKHGSHCTVTHVDGLTLHVKG